ncbi:MAG TPA: AbrB/MazE/SpoVT family DNA-binding domain-containing protein [Candidatus Paceibacterota bacterium]|nr:AbrB/MazE/SpoVT family DNA-binding domain-containing protein [Candidatus Paceibacterota bacterium]
MANIDITRVSSKGQVVIPQDMRKDLKEGDKLIVIRNNEQIILKKAEDFDKNIEEDLKFAKRTEEAWQRHRKGDFKIMEFDDFLKEVKKW